VAGRAEKKIAPLCPSRYSEAAFHVSAKSSPYFELFFVALATIGGPS